MMWIDWKQCLLTVTIFFLNVKTVVQPQSKYTVWLNDSSSDKNNLFQTECGEYWPELVCSMEWAEWSLYKKMT